MRAHRFLTACAALAALFALPRAVGAEELVVSLSTREVAITSTYTGADITAFGLVERDANTIARTGVYDIVISVQGPRGDVVVQQKAPIGPVWLTSARKRFSKIPLFFSVLSARALADVTDGAMRERLKLGLEYHIAGSDTPAAQPLSAEERGFREALIRLAHADQALVQDEKAVTMVRPNLFSARIALPATAPTGLYLVNITVLTEGVPLKTAQAGFVVRKVGFDAFVADSARSNSLIYAIVTILMALALGWLANVVFRRD